MLRYFSAKSSYSRLQGKCVAAIALWLWAYSMAGAESDGFFWSCQWRGFPARSFLFASQHWPTVFYGPSANAGCAVRCIDSRNARTSIAASFHGKMVSVLPNNSG